MLRSGLTLLLLGFAPPVYAAERQGVDFGREIRPLLSRNCFACHGPDEDERQAGLRLDRRADALAELDSGERAIVPGDAEASELYRRIASDDEFLRMPPADSGHTLTSEEIDRIGVWIDAGAAYVEHWSFTPPVRPAAPQGPWSTWSRGAIDDFVARKLDQNGLEPAAEADRYTLIRRLSLDLRGLPPTPREIADFVGDARPGAYERLVDRFLADAGYGERWARVWLDQARYADSAGYGSDPLRLNMWRYRDWVIDALNRNQPYDRFTIDQLAGDLVPDPTLAQRMATAFHRNTKTNTEGGTDDEEFRVEAVRDRVDTTMQVWMGLSMGCAKCHSHKYDPITQAEYYQFYAFFNQTADRDRPDEAPVMQAPTPSITRELKQIDAEVAALKQTLATPTEELARRQAEWEASLQIEADWVALEPQRMEAASGATLKMQDDGSILAGGKAGERETYMVEAPLPLERVTAMRLEAIPDPSLPQGGSGRADDGNFVLSRIGVTAHPAGEPDGPPRARFVRIELPGKNKILSLAEVQVFSGGNNVAPSGKATQSSTDYDGRPELAIDGNTDGHYFDAKSTTHTRQGADPWWELDLGDSKPVDELVLWNRTDGNNGARLAGFRVRLLDADRKPVWEQDVADPPQPKSTFSPSGRRSIRFSRAAADFSQKDFPVAKALEQKDLSASGWAVAPHQTSSHQAVFVAAEPFISEAPSMLTVTLDHQFKQPGYALGRFRLSVTSDKNVTRRISVPEGILQIVDTPPEERSESQRETLAAYYRSIAPSLQPIRDEIARLEKSRPKVPTLPIMQELPEDKRRTTNVMVKGNFLSPGETVTPAVPAAFHPLDEDAPQNRLGVARWLVDRDNPLTARVAVNRIWAQLFGFGLVETQEDFGSQGELPSHPELLDWLATELMRLDWDVKALLKQIVTSATYRQSSQTTPEKLELDPRNRLYSRGPRFRLEAEMVRDQALAASGLLSRKIGGPSVYPVQPPNLWQAAFNGQRNWATSEGEDRYRRGLYTFWRRTVPYPSMATFDAPSREICSARRIRTNTPLQAFVTLNDPVYFEAAQALARRIVREGGTGFHERLGYAFLLTAGRPLHERQRGPLVALYENELAYYRDHAEEAKKLATDPLGPLPADLDAAELAAWTVVANVLLNMDAVLMKG